MENGEFSETLQYLKMHPGFLKTYIRYMQLAQAGDAKAKQLLNILVSSNRDMFIGINELLKKANEGDAYAKQAILDNLKDKVE